MMAMESVSANSCKGSYPGLELGDHHGDAHERAERAVFAFWIFLMSDLVIFGILFATYAAYLNPMGMAGAPGPADLFNITSVAIQTALLLLGGAAYGAVSLCVKHNKNLTSVIAGLIVCVLFGAGFLYFEISDFVDQAAKGGVPQASGWLSAYWTLVGLHGIHVFIGVLWIIAMIAQIAIRGMDDAAKVRLSMLGVFWHFLDLIWIGIFSLVFLVPLI